MIKHSPLPWTIESGEEPEHRQIWDANLQCVAEIYGPPEAEYPGPAQDILNNDTKLIAAAPRMYALLKSIATSYMDMNDRKSPWKIHVENLMNDIEEP